MLPVNAAVPAVPGGMSQFLSVLWPFLLMFAVFYFLLVRPQQKKQKHRNIMLNSLKKGDKVVTIGGLRGTIMEINDDTVLLRVNDVTKITFDRNAISQILPVAEKASSS